MPTETKKNSVDQVMCQSEGNRNDICSKIKKRRWQGFVQQQKEQ